MISEGPILAKGVCFSFFRADGWVGGWRRTPPPSLSSKRDLQHAYREQGGGLRWVRGAKFREISWKSYGISEFLYRIGKKPMEYQKIFNKNTLPMGQRLLADPPLR